MSKSTVSFKKRLHFHENTVMIPLESKAGKQELPAKADPDVTLAAKDRKDDDLRIFSAENSKNIMADIKYEYKDGRNVLTMIKNL